MNVPGHPDQQPPHQDGMPQPPAYQPNQQSPAAHPGEASPVPPGQPMAGQHFPGALPSKKKRRWVLPTVIGGVVTMVLCCGGVMVAALSGNPTSTDTDPVAAAPSAESKPSAENKPAATAAPAKPKAAEDGPKTYKVGQSVRGGDFEFVVHRVKCKMTSVGDSFLKTKAQGEFCQADISVKNVTKKAHLFHADGTVTAQDGSDREYSADGTAGMYGNKDGAGFLEEINPGNSIRAFVYFDVPKGTKLTSITFDAGLFTLAEDAVVKL